MTVKYNGFICANRSMVPSGEEGKEQVLVKYLNERTGFVTDPAKGTVYDNALTATRNGYIAGCNIIVEVECTVTSILSIHPASTSAEEVKDVAEHLGIKLEDDDDLPF